MHILVTAMSPVPIVRWPVWKNKPKQTKAKEPCLGKAIRSIESQLFMCARNNWRLRLVELSTRATSLGNCRLTYLQWHCGTLLALEQGWQDLLRVSMWHVAKRTRYNASGPIVGTFSSMSISVRWISSGIVSTCSNLRITKIVISCFRIGVEMQKL